MFKFLSKIFDANARALKNFMPLVEKVNTLEDKMRNTSIEDMKKRFFEMRKELIPLVDKIPEEMRTSLRVIDKKRGLPKEEIDIQNKLFEFCPEVFAAIREVMRREFGRRHFDVQVLAGVILASGQKLTELKTGEGKTQVFHLPLALYALTGRGVHAITVNDYLARIHGEYAGHILSRLGFSVGIITPQNSYKFITTEDIKQFKGQEIYDQAKKQKIINPGDVNGYNLLECNKKEAYDCEIVYGTNNEFGFDYLRDNMAFSLERIVQRELYFCIVDEADSILIDEARTPLIISAPAEESNKLYQRFASIIPKLDPNKDYTVDEKAHSVVLTDAGTNKVEGILGVDNLWQDYKLAHHLENALKAYSLYKKDKEYLVKNGEVLIIDQFTGRVLPGRRYSEGLHQAIEAKEGVNIKRESKTLATITFQNFFRMYKILDGASGTIMTEAEEFYKIYNLDSLSVPTNMPVIRKDYTDRVYKNRVAKFNAVKDEVKLAYDKGQPVLVGTTSIEDSEYLSSLLDGEGIAHEVLNAKYHEKESKIIANAGKKGSVTVATNMAGRGTDIRLGGQDATDKEYREVVKLGGLYVIGTERHEARRIDNQLRGRSGRQGDPGQSRFFVALDDKIMRMQGGQIVQRLMEMTKIPDDMPIESGLVGNSIESAQKKMEGYHFDIRKHLVDYDDVMNQQREIFYERRRRILEMTENAKGKFFKGRDVILDEDEKLLKVYYEKIKETITNYINLEIKQIVNAHYFEDREDKVDLEKIIKEIMDLSQDDLIVKAFDHKTKKLNSNKIYDHMFIDLENKNKSEVINYFVNLFNKVKELKFHDYGKDLPDVVKLVILESMDNLWADHIEEMQDLREGIGLRGYAQKDPLVEYKNEAFAAFDQFIHSIDSRVARRILKMVRMERAVEPSISIETNADEISDVLTGTREMFNMLKNSTKGLIGNSKQKNIKKVVALDGDKFKGVGRNDPCPCGSGKKFKKCHGRI